MATRFTVRCGSAAGVPVRVHALLPLVVVFALLTTPGYTRGEVLLSFLVFFGVMVASILLHEVGHALVARRHGLRAHGIELWPLGGCTDIDPPAAPRARVAVAAAGVAVNLLLALMAGAALLVRDGEMPGLPSLLVERDLLRTTWNLNLALAVLNLLPGTPFDGGGVVEGWLWRRLGRPRARLAMAGTGAVICIGLVIGGFAQEEILLAAVGIWGLHECGRAYREIREAEGEEGADPLVAGTYDFSAGNRSLEASLPAQPPPSRAEERARRAEERRAAAARRAREEAERRLDGLLERISVSGLDSLSAADRAFLDEESRRRRG